MARLIKKLCLFGLLAAVALSLLSWLSARPQCRQWFAEITSSDEYAAGEGEAEQYIKNVSEETPRSSLILGDSVCNQLFDPLKELNPDCCINGNNRGMTMAGEYLLFDEFLRHQKQVTDLYLIVGPDMLQSGIDVIYGYQYVVIPFARYGMLDRLEPETVAQMEEMYGAPFLNETVARLIGDSGVNRKLYLNYLKEKYAIGEAGETGTDSLSQITCVYLPKIAALCEQNQITLHLLPTPQADNLFRRDQIAALRQRVEELGLSAYFEDYFAALRYYPDEQFLDGTHFGGEYDNREYFDGIIRQMYLEPGYMKGLALPG